MTWQDPHSLYNVLGFKMVEIVLFACTYDFHSYAFDDFIHMDHVTVIPAYPFRIGGFRYRLWNIYRSFAGKSENFSGNWLQRTLHKKGIKKDSDVAFCFVDSAFEYYSRDFVDWLRRTYIKSKQYVICLNSIEGDRGKKILERVRGFDAVFSFDSSDCSRYGWRFFWGLMPTIDKSWFRIVPAEGSRESECDLCFIGADKGRYEELKTLYIRLSGDGLRCRFLLRTDREAEDETDRAIILRESIPFREVLRMEDSSAVLLDYGFLKTGEQGFTLRIMDAVGLGKSMITTNQNLLKCPIYDSEKAAVIHDLDEITPEMIRTLEDGTVSEYKNTEIFSACHIIESIAEDFRAAGDQRKAEST